jgi:hypothetical protein
MPIEDEPRWSPASARGAAHDLAIDLGTATQSGRSPSVARPCSGRWSRPSTRIAGLVREVWDALPRESREEVSAHGLCLIGGGARLRLLVDRVRQVTSVEPRVPEDPLHAVITGASRMALAGG